MKEEFISKMIQAKKLEMEALQSLLPQEMGEHLNVIRHEVKEMGKDLVKSCITKTMGTAGGEELSKKNVTKVEIE